MNKKGFVFIEMIMTTVILIVAMLILYNTYSNVIYAEKQRLYYDDIAYVYKAETVRDIIIKNIDYGNFYTAVNDAKSFIYIFNYGSNIWTPVPSGEGNQINALKEFYDFYQLGYIKISDLPQIKKCIKNKKLDDTKDNEKCQSTLNILKKYNYANLSDYIRSIDVDTNSVNAYSNHDGILITMFFTTKNGEKQIGKDNYLSCIQDKATDKNNHYISTTLTYSCSDAGLNSAQEAKCEKALNDYNKDEKVSFDMSCENAYHLTWVYF